MKIHTIDYKKHFWNDWVVYKQTIKIDDELKQKYNNHLRYLYKKIDEKKNVTHTFNCDDMCISLYTKPLKKWINYLHYTGLLQFIFVAKKIWINLNRLLFRNTIIEVL